MKTDKIAAYVAILLLSGLSDGMSISDSAGAAIDKTVEQTQKAAAAKAAAEAALDAILAKNNVPSSDVARDAVKEVQGFNDRPLDEANIKAVISLLEEKKPVTKDAMDFRAAKVVIKSDVFPMACGNPDKTKDLKVYGGNIEKSPTGKFVLSVPDSAGVGGVKAYVFDDKVGLMGSSIPDPVVSITSQGKYSEGYVTADGKVQCFSQEIPSADFAKNNTEKKYANPAISN